MTSLGTIHRNDLQAAIEAGIKHTQTRAAQVQYIPALSDEEIERLRAVGKTAKQVGTNFNGEHSMHIGPGCPATQACLVNERNNVTTQGAIFASAYDEYLRENHLTAEHVIGTMGGHLEVVDD